MRLLKQRVRSSANLLFLVCVGVMVISRPAFCQDTPSTGKVQGTVTGKDGEKIAAAKVIITNQANKQAIATTTKPDGTYISAELPPGDYAVRVDTKGFESPVVPVSVQAGLTATADVRVLPSVVEINTDRSNVDGALRAEQIDNLPINGRNVHDLGQLEPGIQSQDANSLAAGKTGALGISIDSVSARQSRTHVDGADLSDEVSGGPLSNLPQSSVQEFR